MLISGRLDDDSRVLLERNIRSRLAKVAPFLSADADPYIIMVNGELKWVVDMYTVSDRYPYSQSTISDTTAFTARLDRPEGNPALPSRFNYIRNSVKVVVDAFDGSMTFYVVDPSDPIIAAYQRIYPTLFTPGDAMPQEIREHLRYPQDLFRVQSDAYSTYHITDSREFFSDLDPWQIAPRSLDLGPPGRDPVAGFPERRSDRVPADAALLPAHEVAGRGGPLVPPLATLHPTDATQHGVLHGGEVGRSDHRVPHAHRQTSRRAPARSVRSSTRTPRSRPCSR